METKGPVHLKIFETFHLKVSKLDSISIPNSYVELFIIFISFSLFLSFLRMIIIIILRVQGLCLIFLEALRLYTTVVLLIGLVNGAGKLSVS